MIVDNNSIQQISVIHYPEMRMAGAQKRKYHLLCNSIVKYYNDNLPCKKKIYSNGRMSTKILVRSLALELRRVHEDLLMSILHLAAQQITLRNNLCEMYPEKRKINLSEPFVLHTNNVQLGKFGVQSRSSASTVWRWLKRLEMAGIILEKRLHGATKDYELLIDPRMLMLYDRENPALAPVIPDAEIFVRFDIAEEKMSEKMAENADNGGAAEAAAAPQEIATCKPLYNLEQKINNKNNTLHKEFGERPNMLAEQTAGYIEVCEDPQPNEGILGERKDGTDGRTIPPVAAAPPAGQPIFSFGRVPLPEGSLYPIKPLRCDGISNGFKGSNIERFSYFIDQLSRYVTNHILNSYLFAGRNIYNAEIERTYNYIRTEWLGLFTTEHQALHEANVLIWCIDSASRNAKRNKMDLSNIYPRAWIDRYNNGMSLLTVRFRWWPETEKFYKKRKWMKRLAFDRKALYNQIKNVDLGDVGAYKRAEAFVRAKYPHLLQEFYDHFNNPARKADFVQQNKAAKEVEENFESGKYAYLSN